MKRVFFIITMVLSVYSIWAQDTERKYQIKTYYKNKENLTHTVNYAIANWTYRTITTPYHTKTIIYGIDIKLFQNGNNTHVERIILENGTAGGNVISFEKAFFAGSEESQKEFVAHYSESFSDYEPPGFVIWIYEANNLDPNTEIITLVLNFIKE